MWGIFIVSYYCEYIKSTLSHFSYPEGEFEGSGRVFGPEISQCDVLSPQNEDMTPNSGQGEPN